MTQCSSKPRPNFHDPMSVWPNVHPRSKSDTMSIQPKVHPTQFPSNPMSIRPISKVITYSHGPFLEMLSNKLESNSHNGFGGNGSVWISFKHNFLVYLSTLFLNGVFRYVVGVDKDLHLKELELVMKEYTVEKNHTNVISVIISLPREQVWMFIFKHITKSLPVIKQLKSIPSSRKQNDLAMVKTTPLPQKMNNWCGKWFCNKKDSSEMLSGITWKTRVHK